MVSFRKFDVLVHGVLNVANHAAEVAAGDIGRNHYLTGHILAVYGVRTGRRTNISHIGKRNLFSCGSIYRQILYALGCATEVVAHLKHKVERALSFVDHRHLPAGKQDAYRLLEFGKRDAIAREHLPLRYYFQLGTLYLLLHIQVGHSFDALDAFLNLVTYQEHTI